MYISRFWKVFCDITSRQLTEDMIKLPKVIAAFTKTNYPTSTSRAHWSSRSSTSYVSLAAC